jgi:hypothetical protein
MLLVIFARLQREGFASTRELMMNFEAARTREWLDILSFLDLPTLFRFSKS